MKFAKKTLSILLAMIMAFGIFSVASSATVPADYTALNNAIEADLPDTANTFFYSDEAVAFVDNILDNYINWNLTAADQATVDGYIANIAELGALLQKTVTDSSESPLTLSFGGYSFPYVYPYGTNGIAFYPFRNEAKAVNTLALKADKTAVPMVTRGITDDQVFTVTLSIGSNALNRAAGIPILFDKTRLEVVGVDNSGANVSVTPSMISGNLSSEYNFTATLNPSSSAFWPAVYRNDTVFKAKWAGINIVMTQNISNGLPYNVLPAGQENVLSINFKVKSGAPAGNAAVYVDPAFTKDAENLQNKLYFERAADANSTAAYDTLATYGSTINTAAAAVTVEVVDVLLGDTNCNGDISIIDAYMALQASNGILILNDKQKLQADVIVDNDITLFDAYKILQYVTQIITHF